MRLQRLITALTQFPRRLWPARRRTKIIALVVVVIIGLTGRLFVWPDLNAPVHSDAIVVLGGGGARLPAGIKLAEEGYAPLIIFSIYPGQSCIPSTPKITVRCLHAVPLSTRGEARAIGHLARRLHLHRIILVMTTPQATRARLRVGRCFSGQILIDGVNPGGVLGWAWEFAYEWAALFKAVVLQPSC
ncbi:MAG TPA: hypothetical protein VGL48_07950 [Acidimicrobiales bacterium]|jgi:uncharacterized SAM-binding protein YcdF (DUF218 family)